MKQKKFYVERGFLNGENIIVDDKLTKKEIQDMFDYGFSKIITSRGNITSIPEPFSITLAQI